VTVRSEMKSVAVISDSSYELIENNTIKNSASHFQQMNVYESGNEVGKKSSDFRSLPSPGFLLPQPFFHRACGYNEDLSDHTFPLSYCLLL